MAQQPGFSERDEWGAVALARPVTEPRSGKELAIWGPNHGPLFRIGKCLVTTPTPSRKEFDLYRKIGGL